MLANLQLETFLLCLKITVHQHLCVIIISKKQIISCKLMCSLISTYFIRSENVAITFEMWMSPFSFLNSSKVDTAVINLSLQYCEFYYFKSYLNTYLGFDGLYFGISLSTKSFFASNPT